MSTGTSGLSATGTSGSSSNTNTVVSSLVSQVVSQLQQKGTPSLVNILGISLDAMQIVEAMPSLTGPQKLSLVMSAVTTLINSSSLGSEEKSMLNSLVSALLPSFAGLITTVASGLSNINVKSCCQSSGGCGCC